MKRIAVLLTVLCLLTVSVSAANVPDNVIHENRDGQELIIKSYTLSPDADPDSLIEDPFELEGYRYEHLETVKEEQPFQESKQCRETVTVNTSTDDLAAILAQLSPAIEYSKDGYSGTLTLDHTTIQTEAAGYTTKSYTITDTRQITGLDRNDPSYVPATSTKNGTTLALSNITWAVTGTSLADDVLVPTSFTATATYSATASRRVATGYVTTADYTGEVTAQGIRTIQYTVTYLGTPLSGDLWGSAFPWLILSVPLLLVIAAIVYLLRFRPNASVYAMNAKGVAYKKLGRQRITARSPILDLTRLKEYPAGEASVELQNKTARQLIGRIITIRLYDGTRTHLVEPFEGNENYWFAVKEEQETS